jgi:DNA topoisomerase-1
VLAKDDKKRTQYIYHPLFVELTNREKYFRLKDFISKLPNFMRAINDSLYNPKTEKEYIIAIMFRIMMLTHSRVGNDFHEDSFGLTTLEKKHIQIHGSNIYFSFKGKKGI